MTDRKKTRVTNQHLESKIDLSRILRIVSFAVLGLALAWAMIQPLDSTSVFDGSALLQNMVWILLALLVSIEHFVSDRRLRLGKVELLCLAAISLWLFIVTVNASHSFNPRTGWNGFWHLISAIAIYFAVRSLIRTNQERLAVLQIFLVGAVSLSGVALYQVNVSFPEMRRQYFSDPDKQLAQMGIDAPEGSPTRKRFEDRINSPEPCATFALANSLAAFLSAGLVLSLSSLALGVVLKSRSQSDTGIAKENANPQQLSYGNSGLIALSIVSLLIAVVWFLTRSRIALLAVPTALGAMILGALGQSFSSLARRLPARARNQVVFGLIVALGVFALGMFLLWRRDPLVFSEATKSLTYRLEYWQATLKIIQQYPIFGIGFGNFQAIYPQFMLDTASETIADPHNWILDLCSCCSLPIALVVVLGVCKTLLTKPLSFLPNAEPSYHRVFSFGAIFGGLLVMLGLYVFGQEADLIAAIIVTAAAATGIMYWVGPILSASIMWSNLTFKAVPLAMLLCLLVSGSWQAAGLLVPILVCLAVSNTTQAQVDKIESGSPWLTRAALITSLVVFVGFVFSSWLPIVNSQAEAARASADIEEQLASVERARSSDPSNSEWDRFWAKLLVDKALATSSATQFERDAAAAVDSLASWVAREPMSFLTWQFAGDCCLELAGAAQKKSLATERLIEQAANYYDRAVQTRPNSAKLRIQLAYCLVLHQEIQRALPELEKAERISLNTPHVDQKIESELIWIPIHPVELSPQNSAKPYCRAELVVDWIRSQQTTKK